MTTLLHRKRDCTKKKAVITAEITATEGEIVAFDFICDVLDYTYVSGGLLFSIDDRPLESELLPVK